MISWMWCLGILWTDGNISEWGKRIKSTSNLKIRFSEILVACYLPNFLCDCMGYEALAMMNVWAVISWRLKLHLPPKHFYPPIYTQCYTVTQKTTIWNITRYFLYYFVAILLSCIKVRNKTDKKEKVRYNIAGIDLSVVTLHCPKMASVRIVVTRNFPLYPTKTK